MAETLMIISTVSFVLSAICLVLAIFFWIQFKIPTVIGDLSGRNAKKTIERIRANNEKSGYKSFRPSTANMKRGKLTEAIDEAELAPSETEKKAVQRTNVAAKAPNSNDSRPETGLLSENAVDVNELSEETGYLQEMEETERLETEVPETEVLEEPANLTGGKKLTMMDEVMLIHTDEVIG